MVTRKKTDMIQLSKIRMREALRARLKRESDKKGITLNAEIVERLERSFDETRDSKIIDMMVMNDSPSAALVRSMVQRLARNPNWAGVKAAKDLMEVLSSEKDEPEPGADK